MQQIPDLFFAELQDWAPGVNVARFAAVAAIAGMPLQLVVARSVAALLPALAGHEKHLLVIEAHLVVERTAANVDLPS